MQFDVTRGDQRPNLATLGFGEIPIKGLPRYLAIIQGFIGWFMLTIFSVSLISQLLN